MIALLVYSSSGTITGKVRRWQEELESRVDGPAHAMLLYDYMQCFSRSCPLLWLVQEAVCRLFPP